MAKVTKEKKGEEVNLADVDMIQPEPTFAEQVTSAVPDAASFEEAGASTEREDFFVSYRCPSTNITSEPYVEIKGVVHKLAEIPPEKLREYNLDYLNYRKDNNLLVQPVSTKVNVRYSGEKLETGAIKFYSLEMDGFVIIMTQGSSLILKEGFLDDRLFDYGDIIEPTEARLTLIGASIDAARLEMKDKCVLNNTTIIAKRTIALIKSTISASFIDVENTTIINSTLNSTQYSRIDNLDINDCYLTDMSIQEAGFVEFRECKCYSGDHVSFYFSHFNKPNFKINSQLFGHAGRHLTKGDNQTKYILSINRRIDYGYFIGLNNIPFIRANACDILVSGELFKAEELFPQFKRTSEKPNPVPVGSGPFSLATPINDGWVATLRDGPIWERVAKLIYPNNNVLGKNADKIILDLITQIKSRVEIYIELDNLGIENGRNYQY